MMIWKSMISGRDATGNLQIDNAIQYSVSVNDLTQNNPKRLWGDRPRDFQFI